MTKGNKEIMNWQNGILLSAVSYAIYLIFWLVLDDDTARLLPEMTVTDYLHRLPAVCAFHIHFTGILLYSIQNFTIQSLLYQSRYLCILSPDNQQSGGFRYDVPV